MKSVCRRPLRRSYWRSWQSALPDKISWSETWTDVTLSLASSSVYQQQYITSTTRYQWRIQELMIGMDDPSSPPLLVYFLPSLPCPSLPLSGPLKSRSAVNSPYGSGWSPVTKCFYVFWVEKSLQVATIFHTQCNTMFSNYKVADSQLLLCFGFYCIITSGIL